jgi:hypothetical protein
VPNFESSPYEQARPNRRARKLRVLGRFMGPLSRRNVNEMNFSFGVKFQSRGCLDEPHILVSSSLRRSGRVVQNGVPGWTRSHGGDPINADSSYIGAAKGFLPHQIVIAPGGPHRQLADVCK